VPWANGGADYFTMINARDGGINGVKIRFEECETGYATDRGVECFERLKGGGEKGAVAFSPLSTGITFALTEKAPVDKIPLETMGYGRSESADGRVFQWNFPLLGTYWSAADILIQHLAKQEGGLKGKKVTLVYHDSPFGKEPISILQDLARSRATPSRRSRSPTRRRAEGRLAPDPPRQARLRAPVGLGRDERHRDQGGGRGGLSQGEDVRRLVGRGRARRPPRRASTRRATAASP
jgi:hypothetical protein